MLNSIVSICVRPVILSVQIRVVDWLHAYCRRADHVMMPELLRVPHPPCHKGEVIHSTSAGPVTPLQRLGPRTIAATSNALSDHCPCRQSLTSRRPSYSSLLSLDTAETSEVLSHGDSPVSTAGFGPQHTKSKRKQHFPDTARPHLAAAPLAASGRNPFFHALCALATRYSCHCLSCRF